MTPNTAMIFAAGLGTRMGELTRTRPKPLIEVAGRPLIDHAISLVREAGVNEIVVNTHAHAEQMHAHLREVASEVQISHETTLLDTGGGMKHAATLLGDGPIFALNADMVWRGPNPLRDLAVRWDPGEMDSLLCVLARDRAIGHAGPGDFFRHSDGTLERRGQREAADFVYTGAQIIDAGILDGFAPGKFSLNVVWDRILAAGRMKGVVYDGSWVDVGTPEGISLAEAELMA